LANDEVARRLVWVPIIHTPEDMGKLQAQVRDRHLGRGGTRAWTDHVRRVGEFWREVRRRVERLGVDPARLRLYQDALPVCGFEEKIIRELAGGGGLNQKLLVDLMGRGASLMGTESPPLLVEEYELNRRALAGDPPADFAERTKAVLEARDAFIASRIAQTLQAGEVGLIFLGMAHSLEGRLPADVRVERLDVATPR
jgi:hypothetical protein